MSIKVFALGNHGFVSPAVLRLLDAEPWQRQQRVLVSAPSRAHAIALVGTIGIWLSARDPELARANGADDVEALLDAAFFDSHALCVVRMTVTASPVVVFDATGGARVAGRLSRDLDRRVVYTTA